MCSITINDMYARTAFRFQEATVLCPFLTELDTTETKVQAVEETAIQEETPKHQKSEAEVKASAIFLGVQAGIGAGVLFFSAAELVAEMVLPAKLLPGNLSNGVTGIIIAASIVTGITVGVLTAFNAPDSHLSEVDCRTLAIKSLEICRYRALRLDAKVNAIALKLQEQTLPVQDRQQLEESKFFFNDKLTSYKTELTNQVTMVYTISK